MDRGDIYLANLNSTVASEQAETRPVLIVTRNAINASSPVVVIVPLTKYISSKRIYPSQISIPATESNGLSCDSIAKAEQIRAISKSRLKTRLGSLSSAKLRDLSNALKITLDLD